MRTAITLNLRQGGGSRIEGIFAFLKSQAADFVICTEYRNNKAGAQLLREMKALGYREFLAPAEAPSQNSVAVFAPASAEEVKLSVPMLDRHRIVMCREGDFTVVGVYFAQLNAKASLFSFLNAYRYEPNGMSLVMGDFNTGRHFLDETGATFSCERDFRQLSQSGLVDLWRKQHGEEKREFTWVSNKGGEFRIDHAFGSSRLAERLVDCRYLHETRGSISDHSAMMVQIV